MDKANLLSFFQQLPSHVRTHVFDDALAEMYAKKTQEFNLSREQGKTLTDLVWQVYQKELVLPNFITAVEKSLKLGPDQAKKLSVQIIGFDFLPIADYLGVDVERYLKELGVDTHVFEKKVNPNEIVEELVLNANLRFPDPQLDSRLKDIILNRLNNVRDDLETKTVLMRSTKLGGLELSEESASKVLGLIQFELEALAQKKVVLTPTLPPPTSRGRTEEGDMPAESLITPPIGPIRPIGPISPIKPVAVPLLSPQPSKSPVVISPPPTLPIVLPPPASLPKPPVVPPAPPKLPVVQPALPKKPEPPLQPIGQISPIRPVGPISPIRSASPQTPRAQLKSKSGDILDPEEAEELKSLTPKVPRSAVNTAEIIARSLASLYEDANLTFDDPILKARFETIAANRLKDIRDSIETRELLLRAVNLGGMGFSSEVRDRVATLLDKEFTRTKEELHDVKSREFQAQTRVRQEEKERGKLEGERKEKEDMDSRWQRLVKPGREISRESKREEGKPSTSSGNKSIFPERSAAESKGNKPEPAFQPQPPAPSLEDVKYTPRLIGPLEELKNFSIDDFRKLGAKSRDAAARLQGKLDVLRGESMEKKISGVQALKTSPLYKLYMSILAESLVQGKKPTDIIVARRTAAKETLSEEEFSAIMELSSALRY